MRKHVAFLVSSLRICLTDSDRWHGFNLSSRRSTSRSSGGQRKVQVEQSTTDSDVAASAGRAVASGSRPHAVPSANGPLEPKSAREIVGASSACLKVAVAVAVVEDVNPAKGTVGTTGIVPELSAPSLAQGTAGSSGCALYTLSRVVPVPPKVSQKTQPALLQLRVDSSPCHGTVAPLLPPPARHDVLAGASSFNDPVKSTFLAPTSAGRFDHRHAKPTSA